MNDRQLEEQIRSLVPAPLPSDLAARMTEPPQPVTSARLRFLRRGVPAVLSTLAAAACVVLVWRHATGPAAAPDDSAPQPVVTVHMEDSRLLETRTLEVLEHDGGMWEIAEQEWQDSDTLLCSNSPIQMRMATTRRELVCRPVHFD
ncbi:hypothetical protein HAHE_25660 [Haloferula helveola]|uniref:Uncharacterized protein n=1 Tax=Haloferula helveola TaxID=490095 RepID=A0ABN6H684_9BACT|nr:hypothetical protein HAHE_25660 [Haloferula helveola]